MRCANSADLGQRDDRVPIALARHVVDEIDDAVLESADVEAVDDVNDQGPAVAPGRNLRTHHRVRAAFSQSARRWVMHRASQSLAASGAQPRPRRGRQGV